jgi:hypothetical protein
MLLLLCGFLFVPTIVVTMVWVVGSAQPQVTGGNDSGYTATGVQIVAYAKQWLNIPYVWGGTNLNIAVDCSGFTYSVYANFGINLPRTAWEQGHVSSGTVVNSIQAAMPGDLIWWPPRHVGIYIGDGKAIQSSGDDTNTDLQHAGRGVTIVAADYRAIGTIHRFVTDLDSEAMGHQNDRTVYTQTELELIWAIVAQEDSTGYDGSLAVISSAMNRISSPVWRKYGNNALKQLTAAGQYCYSRDIGGSWQERQHGNVPNFTKQAVQDCLIKGVRNHNFFSFRSTKKKSQNWVQIGGNWYFDVSPAP